MAQPTISVIIISRDEEHDIAECLSCVAWADELIVVDAESSDRTAAIAREHTPHVHVVPWMGFGPQKNHALDLATGEWILSLDCDERVSEQLREEIIAACSESAFDAWLIPFRTSYCGRFMRFGDWSMERKLRLFRKGAGRFSDVPVHEKLQVAGPTGRLSHPILHYSVPTHEELMAKVETYAALGARLAHDSGRRTTSTAAACRCAWTFFRGYLLRGGFLDGRRGFKLACALAYGTWLKHASLAGMSRESS